MPDWSEEEIKLIIADYFEMLSLELAGKTFSKAVHRRNLIPLLNNRSEGSIEFKHQNISAILIEMGQPFIRGYLPRFNYQHILKELIVNYLNRNLIIEDQFRQFSDKEVTSKVAGFNFTYLIVDPPKTNIISEPIIAYHRNPIKTNYLEREQKNQKLGFLGEELVLEFEKWHLRNQGREKFANQVRWISKEEGDGAGFDILSRNLNGTDKYIEVKTTKLAKETPIFFTRNELDFSIENSGNFHLYRVFNFEEQAKMFIKTGALNHICSSIPVSYKGYF